MGEQIMMGKWTKQQKEKEYEKASEIMNNNVTYLDAESWQKMQDIMENPKEPSAELYKLYERKS